jgi:hypothetical protein
MEKFWAVILIFVIVAAGGLLYVNQVYNPQKETQMAMADTANQTLSAVKMEMGNDDTPSVVDADSVRATVISYCAATDNSVVITVINSKGTKVYTDNSADIAGQLDNESRMFLKKPKTDSSGKLLSIRFEVINE